MPQDFSHRNLRSHSFCSQDLTEANFAGADIRGADFTASNLSNTDFSQAQAGLSPALVKRLLAFSIFLALLSGFITAYAGGSFGYLFSASEPSSIMLGGVIAIGLILFCVTALRTGLGFALGLISLIAATVIVVIIAITPSQHIADKTAVGSLALSGAIAGVVSLAIVISLTRSSKLSLTFACFGIILGIFFGVSEENIFVGFVGVVLISTNVLGLATYIGRKSLRHDRRYQLIRTLAISLSTFGGTRFNNADLTDANFTEAQLSGSDLRGAKLTRTNWHHANLDRANLDRTYLENPKIRHLLTTGDGHQQNYDRLDLRNLNLQNADLSDASLIGADLTSSDLTGANLQRAKLAQAQLYSTNLTGTNLTGAFIQNWGISPDTRFDNIECDYVHMRLPTTQDPDPCRKPDNKQETFRPGDFADFIAPILRTLDAYQRQDPTAFLPKTLDLYHHEGIDPIAAAITLQELIEQNPTAHIDIKSIEGRGQGKICLQAIVHSSADPSQLNRDYFHRYNELKTLCYNDLQQLLISLARQNTRIRSLENMFTTALKSDKFYLETSNPKRNILILAANPKGTATLRLDEEARELQNGLERSRYRDQFAIQQRWAVTPTEVRRALLDLKPTIVHFSGHGIGRESIPNPSPADARKLNVGDNSATEPEGLVLENAVGQPQLVSSEILADLFGLFSDHLECVVLNACFSEVQAAAIARHIPYVVGMRRAIGDQAAIKFAIGFYDAILAGESVEFAYKLGCNAIQIEGIPEHLTPVLKQRL
jgi:uncharacterized protein YjbI with pentapeptide repeats